MFPVANFEDAKQILFSFNAQGDTQTLTKLFAISSLINAILDPLFIFGWLGFPKLGIAGAAIATLLSEIVFIVLAIKYLSGEHRRIRFHFRNLTLKWDSIKKILNIGFPASLTQVIFPIRLAVLLWIMSTAYREEGAIVFSLGFRIEFFA